jgi:hypothetical protein
LHKILIVRRSFSFTEKPVPYLLRTLPSLLPGIEKAVAIFFDPEINSVNSYSMVNDSTEYIFEEIRVNDMNSRLHKYRLDSSPFTWIQKNDIPFEIQSNQKVQLNIFNELDNNILLIRIKNEHDNLCDLYFIYLNQNLSNFGLVNNGKPITTENKTIIGQLLRNTMISILSENRADRELFSIFQENNNSVIAQLNQVKLEFAGAKEKFRNGILHLCRMHLVDLSREHLKTYRLTDSAINRLKEFSGDLALLKPILDKAAQFAEAMHFEMQLNVIEIHDFHLVFDLVVPEIKKLESSPVFEEFSDLPVRYSKTLLLLNKLENAVNNLKVKNKLLTSVNVGNEFPTPVSPSAITDALKKHRSKILHLFTEYPGRWEVIRNEFRPVQNILNPKEERQKNTA